MALTVQDYASLDRDAVQAKQEFISELVQEQNPAIDAKRGVLSDLLFYYSAILGEAEDFNLAALRRSQSLLAVSQDPSLAVDDVVDRLLSNYRLTRIPGATAVGSLTIVVSKLSSVTVPANAPFTAQGQEFRTQVAYVARTTAANLQSSSDRVLFDRGDGTYSFTIEVVATLVGEAGMLKQDTLAIPNFTLVNFIKAFASSDFLGGRDVESNAALLLRLQEGLAAKTASNRINMSALLRSQPAFQNFVAASLIGYGDAEMLRDRHSIFPVSMGGRADWYIRTQALPQSLRLTKTATLIAKTVDGKGTWQFSLDRDEAPGFYDVLSIRPADDATYAGSFLILEDIRSNNTTIILNELRPDIVDVEEGAYSRYQASVMQFTDDQVSTADLIVNGSTRDYFVTVRMMPLIAEIQSFISSRSHRYFGGDVLVRSPIPAFLKLSFTVNGKSGEALPDIDAIKADLASYVNGQGFPGRLAASALADLIHNHLTGSATIGAIDLFAQIRRPDGSILPLRSSDTLIVPSEPDNMVTARTVCFYLDPASISISAQTVNIPEL